MNPSFRRICLAASSLALLAGCALAPNPPLERDFDTLWQAAAENPQVELSAAVLAGELAARRGLSREAAAYYLQAAQLSDEAEIARRATQLALQAEDIRSGELAAARWMQLDPENTGAFEIGARLALRAGERDDAVARLRSLLQLDQGEDGQALVSVAEILALESSGADALQLFAQVVAEQPVTAQLAYAEALLAQRVDQMDVAARAVAQALSLRPDWQAAQLLALRLQLQADDGEAVERSIRDLHVNNPRSLSLRLSLGSMLLEYEQYALARREFRNALKIDPDNTAAEYALGLIEIDGGNLEQAEKHFSRLQMRGERIADTSYYLGRIAEQRGEVLQAMQFYREVRNGRRVLDAAIRQAVIIAGQGQLAAAREYLKTLRSRFEQQALRLWQVEAELLYRAYADEEALAIYSQLIEQYPQDHDLLYGRAIVLERLGQIEQAEADLRRIIADDPEDARSLNALGYMLSNHSDRYAEATELVKRALDITPDDPAVIDSLGWLYFRQGDLTQARQYLERAWAAFKDPEVAAHLGEVLWLQGEQQRAREVWRRGLSRDPDHRVLRSTMQRLESLPLSQPVLEQDSGI